jgi:Zn-dependent protease with chaperone function/type II secretory pathway pseudopilin PulG
MNELAYPREGTLGALPVASGNFKDLVYPRERTLGTLTLVLGVVGWLALIGGTFGTALLALGAGYVLYLFAHSALIAHVKGQGVELSAEQFPDLYQHFRACCERLQISPQPEAYILNGDGGLNAFGTRFLGTQFVVLLADVVDAMDSHPDGVRFYIGHELGHLRMKHLTGQLLRWPVLWLPLVGAAYSRARESTCDRHGLACSSSPENATRALAALSAGVQRWKHLDVKAYVHQTRHTSGFWMAFHELTAGYPWLTKRAARIMNPTAALPGRPGLAYFLAAFVPFAGRMGAGFGFLMMVYIVAILATVALPAFNTYTGKAKVAAVVSSAEPVQQALSAYYAAHEQSPDTLQSAGIAPTLISGEVLALDAANMVLTVQSENGQILFTPTLDAQGKVRWSCSAGEGMKPALLPDSCQGAAAVAAGE